MIKQPPLPATDDPEDAGFWEAARRGELAIQKCGACGRLRHPPRPMCPECQSVSRSWQRVSGNGRIWSFIVAHPPLLPAFMPLAPYNVIVVELEEDPTLRLVGNLVTSAHGAINEIGAAGIEIGARVHVVLQRAADDVWLPRWALQRSSPPAR